MRSSVSPCQLTTGGAALYTSSLLRHGKTKSTAHTKLAERCSSSGTVVVNRRHPPYYKTHSRRYTLAHTCDGGKQEPPSHRLDGSTCRSGAPFRRAVTSVTVVLRRAALHNPKESFYYNTHAPKPFWVLSFGRRRDGEKRRGAQKVAQLATPIPAEGHALVNCALSASFAPRSSVPRAFSCFQD